MKVKDPRLFTSPTWFAFRFPAAVDRMESLSETLLEGRFAC